MRAGVIAAGAVLVLAVVAWWGLRAQEVGGGVTLTARAAELRLQTPREAGQVPAGAVAQRAWVQSAQDKAWCNLPDRELASGGPARMSSEEIQRAIAEDPKFQQAEKELDRVRAAWIAILRARGDERSQAAADLLDTSENAERHLLDLARNTGDPAVYAWAMRTCRGQSDCELSGRRLLQLDPGNLMPWLWEATQARLRGDAQTQREALYQIGLARRNEDYSRELLRLFNELREAQEPGLQMKTEAMVAGGLASAGPLLRAGAIVAYCKEPAGPSSQSVCLDAAESLWRSADTTFIAGIALALAQRDAPRDDPVWSARRKELVELQDRVAESIGLDERKKPAPCRAALVQHRYMTDWASIGQLAILRKLRDTPPP